MTDRYVNEMKEILKEYEAMFLARGNGPQSARKLARLVVRKEFEDAGLSCPVFPEAAP